MSFSESIKAIFSASGLLFKRWRTLAVLLAIYAGLLASLYLFVSTREATIFQLVLTLVVVLVAPALFFLLQAVSVSYANGPTRLRKLASDGLKLLVVSVPVLALTIAAVYGLNKIQAAVTAVTTVRYLLVGVVAPLLAIQLWLATSTDGLRSAASSLKKIFIKTVSPQSLFVYAFGFLIFAVAPYFLLMENITSDRAWLEFSLLVLRISISAVLILLGWVTTVGALSILNRGETTTARE